MPAKIHRVEFCRSIFVPGHGTTPRLTIEEGKPLELEWGTLDDTSPPFPALLVKVRDVKSGDSHVIARIPATSIDCVHEVDHAESQAVVDGKPLSQHREEAARAAEAKAKVEARAKAVRDAAELKIADERAAQKEAGRLKDERIRARKAAEKEQAEADARLAAAQREAKPLPGLRK